MNHILRKCLAALFFLPLVGSAQEMTGIVTGNYAGSSSIFLNPSLIANNHVNWDVNLVTAHTFVENNYFYIPAGQANFQSIVSREYQFPLHPKPFGDGERNIHTYYQDPSPKQVNQITRVNGPSVMFRYNDHAFAFHWGARVITSVDDLPYDMANFTYYGSDFYPQHNINYQRDDYDFATLALTEVGFSYATVISRYGYNHWSAGLTVNRLYPNSAAYMSGGYTDYIVYNDSIVNVNEWNVETGFSLPIEYRDEQVQYIDKLVRGKGWSFDLGVTYQFSREGYRKKVLRNHYKKQFEPYDLKVGVSLIDIGFVKMTENAEKHIFKDVSNHYINVQQLEFDNIHQEMRDISELFYGDPGASFDGPEFRMWLPAALSLQADWHLQKQFFLSGMAVVPLRLSKAQVRRSSVLNISPRFETRMLEVGIPFTLYDLKYPRMGIWVRIYDLTIGTDKLGGFLSARDFTGMDLYLSYKITFPFRTKKRFDRKNPCYFN